MYFETLSSKLLLDHSYRSISYGRLDKNQDNKYILWGGGLLNNNNIFDDLLNYKTVFKNREVLRSTYIPEILPHRESQINQLASILVAALKNETPSNVFIYGKTGTGKTATVKLISKELEKKAKEITNELQNKILNITFDQFENGHDELFTAAEVVAWLKLYEQLITLLWLARDRQEGSLGPAQTLFDDSWAT